MSLELTPLQHHCLDGMGITLWRNRTSQSTQSQGDAQLTAAMPEINEPEAAYDVNKLGTVQPQHLVKQLQALFDYVAKYDKSIKWQVNDDETVSSIIDGHLTLPPLVKLFNSPPLKKQLWRLLADRA